MPFDPRRRRLLKTLVVAATATPFAGPLAFAATGDIRTDAALFPQGLASGDPRPDRVLLWTRAADAAGDDVPLRLQVALDPGFAQLVAERDLRARADADHCLRVRVEGLREATTYHYRFLRETPSGWRSSPHGRTRTAPAADSAASVRIGVMSCQDYSGRWYNTLHALLDDPPDVLLHLGDAIYESAGDPSFQESGGPRGIVFDDIAGALVRGSGEGRYLCARSLDNYRQLHRTFRSDALWQQLLAQVPLVAIWDDHEYSDDCWQDHATYADGRLDERDAARRRNAEQAYFEYMPVDIDIGPTDADGTQSVDADALFPHTRLWRELHFGRDVHLLLTDFRSARPDHLIPEDAFPGALAFDEPALREWLPKTGLSFDAVAGKLLPYVDASHPLWPRWRKPLQRALTRGYRDAGIDKRDAARRVRAILSAPIALMVLRSVLERYNAAVPGFMQAPLPDGDHADLPRGLPWVAMGKTALFGHMGSRYFVVKDGYDLLAALRQAQGQASALGAAQDAWLRERLLASEARWKLVATSVSMTPMVLDLARPELDAPPLYRRRFYLNVDQWDGFPGERAALLQAFDAVGGVVLLSGDIHSGYATQHSARTLEFTVPATSSETLREMSATTARDDAANAEAGMRMVEAMDALLLQGDSSLRYAQTGRNGVAIATVDAQAFRFAVFELPGELVMQDHYADRAGLLARGEWVRFEADAATRTLRRS